MFVVSLIPLIYPRSVGRLLHTDYHLHDHIAANDREISEIMTCNPDREAIVTSMACTSLSDRQTLYSTYTLTYIVKQTDLHYNVHDSKSSSISSNGTKKRRKGRIEKKEDKKQTKQQLVR